MSRKTIVSVLVPCYNESANIKNLIERTTEVLTTMSVPFEVVIVDDGSSDDTYDKAVELKEEYPWLIAIKHEKNAGIAHAWATAFNASSGEIVVTIDADMQYRPEDIPQLISLVREGFDLAQGWRAWNPQGNKIRRLMSLGFSFLLNFFFPIGLKDIKSGFIAYRREAFKEILEDRGYFRYFQHFPTIAAKSKGFSVTQVPVIFERRIAGKSFISNAVVFGLKAMLDLPTALKLYRKRIRKCAE